MITYHHTHTGKKKKYCKKPAKPGCFMHPRSAKLAGPYPKGSFPIIFVSFLVPLSITILQACPSPLHVIKRSLSSAQCAHNVHSNERLVMCQTKNTRRSTGNNLAGGKSDWISESVNGGSLRHVDLHTGTNGWASPPGNVFSLRSVYYFTNRRKSPAGDYLLSPAGMDWLKSTTKLDNVLASADNRVSRALRKSQSQGGSMKSFIFAVNLQIPGGRDHHHHSAVFYFATEEPVRSGSLLDRFVNGDDRFRNERFKLVNRIVRGPWIVKKAVGNHGACLLGKALTCNYHRGPNYLEIDVDIGSSAIANAILRIALGCVTSVTIDLGFVVEAQAEEELPERLVGAVRVCQMEMGAATIVESAHAPVMAARGNGLAKVNHHQSAEDCDVVGANG